MQTWQAFHATEQLSQKTRRKDFCRRTPGRSADSGLCLQGLFCSISISRIQPAKHQGSQGRSNRAAAKHQGSQRCSNCGAGTQAHQEANSGGKHSTAPRLTRVFQQPMEEQEGGAGRVRVF